MKKPFAYITAVWKGGEFTVIDQAAVYCRKVYEAGFTPICPVLYQQICGEDYFRYGQQSPICRSNSSENRNSG